MIFEAINYEAMLPINQYRPFDDPAYLFEPKVGGHRIILVFRRGKACLFDRFGHEVTHRYPELLIVPADEDIILDGEVLCMDRETVCADLKSTRERARLNNKTKIEYVRHRFPVRYFVFDIMQRNGQDLRKHPLMERKKHLDEAVANNLYYRKMKYVNGQGIALFAAAAKCFAAAGEGSTAMEGIVAKRKDSLYIPGPSADWQQMNCYRTEKIYITGYCKRGSGWLIGMAAGDGEIRAAGIVGNDVMISERSYFLEQARTRYAREDHHFVYLRPAIEATLTFRGWNREGKVQGAVYMERSGGRRPDMDWADLLSS